jgi:uncharacterized membrane protein
MTLLVLFIETPQSLHLNNPQQLQIYLVEQYPQFISYLITFFVLANFWVIHHNISRFIIKTNYISLWLNITFMLFIVLLPFTSMILGDYPQFWGSIFLFTGNLFFIISLLAIIWIYASGHSNFIHPTIDGNRVQSIRNQLLIDVFISLTSIILSFFNPSAALYIYLMIPISLGFSSLIKRTKQSKEIPALH